ncbi:MAG: tryptophan synthase subunit alpha [Candidatus Gastranaerophilales bacterium]|nr:tryptophan synthase subunit alpha [Candidatus Gastranaerophilales bacterium]
MSNLYFDKNVFKGKKAFIPFITAGYPTLNDTVSFILQMEKAGADMIEIGIPFSDPIAEGAVIQHASTAALKNGASLDKIFETTAKIRKQTDIPLVFMSYVNPLFKTGYENFFRKCDELNVRGVILPDVPFEEKADIEKYARPYDVDLISMIAPTSNDRIKMIAQASRGFIYVVSSLGVTGTRDEIKTDLGAITDIIKETTPVKTAIGFGINTPKQAEEMSKFSDGVIVGSAIIKIIDKYGSNAQEAIFNYVREMKNACLN